MNYVKRYREGGMEQRIKVTEKNAETVAELVQRVTLHFLGHTGQIYLTKKELGKGGTFVMGVKKKNRYDSREKWLKWWKKNKKQYESKP